MYSDLDCCIVNVNVMYSDLECCNVNVNVMYYDLDCLKCVVYLNAIQFNPSWAWRWTSSTPSAVQGMTLNCIHIFFVTGSFL